MAERSQIEFHQKWIGYLNPTGLVFSPQAIEDAQAVINESVVTEQKNFASLVTYEVDDKIKYKGFDNCLQIFKEVLHWRDSDLLSDAATISDFTFRHPQFDELVSPTYVSKVDTVPKILIQAYDDVIDFDKNTNTQDNWNSSIHFKFERLLREKQIATGILVSKEKFRLIYAPRGETSGFIDFKFEIMHQPSGRIIFAAFKELFSDTRVFNSPKGQSLIEILETSRDYQSKVSIALSGQVLEALYELLRGFQAAYDDDKRDLIVKVQKENPQLIYEGLLTVLLRMVFTMYAEDRELLATDEVYQSSYSLAGLYDRLRLDAAQNPDTMDHRYGAWAHLISLFRLIYDGAEYSSNKGVVKLPARHGHLFDPDIYLFLEGRYKKEDPYDVAPKVSDGVIFRILTKLLYLNGERINYRTLDVEQIGSVYETMMGFELDIAKGPTVAIVPVKSHGAPIPINLEEILDAKSPSKALAESTDLKLSDKVKKEFDTAKTVEDLEKVLDAAKKIDRRATLYTLSKGAMVLRPSEARRKSGSHYTPRELTEPIVSTALRPIFERLGANPKPEEILDLKICDPAMGSGAFLVEACRQLSEKLVESWSFHKTKIDLPSDEDHLMFAKRIIAQKCLYGVDKNHMAVNLAKLSLWLVTLAKDHAFSFLDHNFKHGDSLVGLSNKQIMAFDYKVRQDLPLFQYVKDKLFELMSSREEIQNATDDKNYDALKVIEEYYREEISPLKLVGDLIIKCYFDGKNEKDRSSNIQKHQQVISSYLAEKSHHELLKYCEKCLVSQDLSTVPFHWELEFPEIFTNDKFGFDCFIGNPPFLGAKEISGNFGSSYYNWITEKFASASGQVDFVAYFFLRAYGFLNKGGTLGFISTMSIAKGDTRVAVLEYLTEKDGALIYNAIRKRSWPGVASVFISIIHIIKEEKIDELVLNNKKVKRITSYLFENGTNTSPNVLKTNQNITFMGFYNYGDGFIFADDKESCTPLVNMYEILKEEKYKKLVHPILGGDEFLNSPKIDCQRFVIDFNEMSLEEASRFPKLLSILESKVKPERQACNRERLKKYWWKFGENRPGLRRELANKKRILMHAYTSKYCVFSFIDSSIYVASPSYAIMFEEDEYFGVLQSRIHEIWALFFGGAKEDRLVYTATDCFETFPFPKSFAGVAEIGREYLEYRSQLMIENNEGLTDTYNRFHDPNDFSDKIVKLRKLHNDLDLAVISSYGWSDIILKYDFIGDENLTYSDENLLSKKKNNLRYKMNIETQEEILSRLLKLNQELFDREVHFDVSKKK